jgi:uncharacterized membrane protein
MRTGALLVLALLVTAAVAAPLLGPAGWAIYAAFGWVCHQQPGRSWHLAGLPLAVCVRCLGLYAGALASAAAGWRFHRRAALAALAVLAADWALEAAGLFGPRPVWRFATGLVAGALSAAALWAEPRAAGLRTSMVRRLWA